MIIRKQTLIVLILSTLLGLYFGRLLGSTWLETWSIAFTFFTLGSFSDSLGRGINFKQLIALIASIQYLLMPVITYALFDQRSQLGALWQTFMVVDSDTYFGLALPGTILLWLGLQIPFKSPMSDGLLLERASDHMGGREAKGIT